jgi:hypothetical protein
MHYLELFCVTLVHCYTMTVLAGFDVVGVTDCEIKSPCYPNPIQLKMCSLSICNCIAQL